jgi:predicted DNA-binding transcriptional regulator AlpA
MTVEALYEEIRALRVDMNRLLGIRLNHQAMADRLGVTRRTLYNRIQAGSVPRPGPDGTWLVADVLNWERKETP